MVSANQDPYELPTSKHWRIIHRIHGPKDELLHEFLYYIRVHIYEVLEVVNYIAEVLQKTTLDATRAHIKP
jgi:hypothetical protein